MTKHEVPHENSNYLRQVEGIADSIQFILDIVEPSSDGTTICPTLYPIDVTDSRGMRMAIDCIKIDPIGEVDGAAKLTSVQFSADVDSVHKSIFSLLIKRPLVDSDGGFSYEFKSTDIIESDKPIETTPSFDSFKVDPVLTGLLDDCVLFSVSYDLRALVKPHEIGYPQEQHLDAVEALTASGATIAGVAFRGLLLHDIDADNLPTGHEWPPLDHYQ